MASAGRGKLLGGSRAHLPGDGGLASFHNARQSRTAHPCCGEASARAGWLWTTDWETEAGHSGYLFPSSPGSARPVALPHQALL